jgi:hypothetical protein
MEYYLVQKYYLCAPYIYITLLLLNIGRKHADISRDNATSKVTRQSAERTGFESRNRNEFFSSP